MLTIHTMVAMQEVLSYIDALFLFLADVTALFWQVLTTTYFQYNDEFYEMVDGVAKGRPLSPVVANFFTEKSEW